MARNTKKKNSTREHFSNFLTIRYNPRNMQLSIVIPSYNEAKRLPPTLENIYDYIDQKGLEVEILVVDDGSTDQTGDISFYVQRPPTVLKVLGYRGNRGKGYAVRHGLLRAQGDRVLMTDADLSTPITELDKLMHQLDTDFDAAIGSRALKGSRVVISQPGLRKYGGKLFNLLVRCILPLPFKDTQCGFKLFDRKACLKVFEAMRLDGFSFDVEAMYLAVSNGLRVSEVAVDWYNSEETKVNFARDSVRMLRDVVKVRWWDLTGGY